MSIARPASTSVSICASLAFVMICFDNQSQISVSKSDNGRGSNWTPGETAALLAIWGKTNVQASFDGSVRDQKTYIHISKEMAESGHDCNPIQIK